MGDSTPAPHSGRARIDLLRGDQDAATRWLAAFHGKPDVPIKVYFREYPEITACRVLVAWGTPEDLDQAAFQLERQEEESQRFHLDCHLVPILVIKSLLYSKTKRVQDALAVLEEALGLAWSGRWVLPFIEGRAPVAELLRQLPENPEWGGFVPRILARFDPDHDRMVAQQPEQVAEKSCSSTSRTVKPMCSSCSASVFTTRKLPTVSPFRPPPSRPT